MGRGEAILSWEWGCEWVGGSAGRCASDSGCVGRPGAGAGAELGVRLGPIRRRAEVVVVVIGDGGGDNGGGDSGWGEDGAKRKWEWGWKQG